MFRQSVVAAALLLALICPRAFALGLGEIDMRSALNQPMDAVIQLTSATTADMDDIRVSLASLQDHTRAGLSKAAILADFTFSVEKGASGKPVIRVRSDDLVREPYLEFLLELDWPRGRLLRQYTVLVDPPVTMPATPVAPAAPVSRPATPAPATRAPATLAPVKRPVAAPATTSVAQQSAPNSYGPVRRSETLWSIAKRLRPDEGISIEQMMMALQRANPQAFEGNNINRLLEGVTLTVPTRDEIVSMSRREASAESRRQYAEWQTERGLTTTAAASAPQATADAEPSDTSATATSPAASAVADTGARLQLTAPEEDAVSGAAMPGDPLTGAAGESQDIQQRLALADEEVAAERAQSQELQSRVGELEEQITTMTRLLELKDDELARLQQNIATDDIQPETAIGETTGAEVGAVAESGSVAEVEQDAMDEPVSVEPAPVDTATTPDQGLLGQLTGLVNPLLDRLSGLFNRLVDNPMFAGLGVVVVLVLGGIVWAMRRFRSGDDTLDDEFTMRHQLAGVAEREPVMPVAEVEVDEPVMEESEPDTTVAHDIDSDPVTEADVYLAYGRIQQAEDVLLAALQSRPDNVEARMKLLEVYHSGGNAVAFDQAAAAYHEMFGAGDSHWEKVAAMGLSLSPHNALYGGGAPAVEEGAEFDMDLSGLEQASPQSEPAVADKQDSNTIDFTLDTAASDEEDAGEGLLENVDEMTTKLDLARAYIDMDDADSARSILGEVIEEGNAEQKEEAENIISRLA
jgi:pilus assembly protein FimV